MKYPCLPTQVTQLLQRLAEFVSYLTISSPYLFLQRFGTELQQLEGNGPNDRSFAPKRFLTGTTLPNAQSNAIVRRAIDSHVVSKADGSFNEKSDHFFASSLDHDAFANGPVHQDELLMEKRKFWPSNHLLNWSAQCSSFSMRRHVHSSSDTSMVIQGQEMELKSDKKKTFKGEHTSTDDEDKPKDVPSAEQYESFSTVYKLMHHPALFDPVRAPRYPIVLCHGLYGFDVRGPSSFPMLQMHYWSNVLKVLKKKVGAEVLVTGVPGTGSIDSRAEKLDQFLKNRAYGRAVNFVAHSMGGLDCRHLITHYKPEDYVPVSLTTISTPHRGSPFMDWCMNNIGIGKHRRNQKSASTPPTPGSDSSVSAPETDKAIPPTPSESSFSLSSLPSSFTTLLLSVIDSPAYANLTTSYLQNEFNPSTPNDPNVKYYSVAARCQNLNVWHPLWLPKMVLDGVEEKERERDESIRGTQSSERDDWGNDGLVSVRSARWGEFLGTLENCDHWEIRGARGTSGASIDWSLDIPNPLSNTISSHGWNLKDWGRFVGAWRSAKEKIEQANGERSGADGARNAVENQERDDALKSSTDKLSAVVDWIVEQVPFGPSSTHKESASPPPKSPRPPSQSNPFTSKFDLERFYIALSKKLYNDGL